MTTNVDRVLALIRAVPGLTDGELGNRSGIAPHQQINMICRKLVARGLITRRRGPDGRITNVPVAHVALPFPLAGPLHVVVHLPQCCGLEVKSTHTPLHSA